jgi:hypothetical protein
MEILGDLSLWRALQVLHNPRYAGAFFFGRSRTRTWPDGNHHTQILPCEDWLVLVPHAHVGYIAWEEYEDNQRRLRESAQAQGVDRRKSPPREGPALLQGLAIDAAVAQILLETMTPFSLEVTLAVQV